MLSRLFAATRLPGESWEALRETAGSTVERAVVGGARADRVGYAFALGYAAAVEALAGAGNAALCVTEDGGNHPRAIETRLVDGRVTGTKAWASLADRADHLLVVARDGSDAAGRPRLRVVRVRRDDPGVSLVPTTTAFVPEIVHARLTLDGVPGDVLPGDGYDDYVKPFRTVEDIHVHGAVIGYLVGAARVHGFAHGVIERLAAVAAALVALGAADAKAPATHVALAGALATSSALIAELEAAWQAVPDEEWQRWQRDRALLQVAGRARGERLVRAWQSLDAGAASS